MSGPKFTLRIDEIRCDQPGLDRATLEAALRKELSSVLATQGAEAFGERGRRAVAVARLDPGASPAAAKVAQAVVRSVVK